MDYVPEVSAFFDIHLEFVAMSQNHFLVPWMWANDIAMLQDAAPTSSIRTPRALMQR